MQEPPGASGIDLANWYWKTVRQFAGDRFSIGLSRSSCLNWLHRLGFAFKRPKKRLLKADEAKREAFVAEYAILREVAQRTEARIFFANEAHFRADAELRGKWVLKGQSALVDSTSPRYGEKASHYSAVCLETGAVEWMDASAGSAGGQQQRRDLGCLPGTTEGKTSRAAASHLGQRADPSRRGGAGVPQDAWAGVEAGEPPSTRRQALPGYSPDFNADEAVWGWVREEATGNLCLGSRAAVQDRVGKFLAGLSSRKDEVRRRCRTVLQSRAETLPRDYRLDSHHPPNAHPTLALV